MPGRASATSALRLETALTNQALYAPGRRQTALYRHAVGHRLKGQHSQRKERSSRRRGERCRGTQIAFPDSNWDKKIRRGRFPPLFLGLLTARAGRRETDVYFSPVPSQKSTLPALATITEQLLWLGGPGLGPPRPASLRTPPPPAPGFTPPSVQKQAEGAHESKAAPRVCIRWKLRRIAEFLNRRRWQRWKRGADF